MPKWILIVVLPVLAAVLVFLPALLTEPAPKERTQTPPARSALPLGDRVADSAREQPSGVPSAWQLGASLVFVLTLALGAALVVRRVQAGSPAARSGAKIEVRESRRLGKGRAIHYVRVGEHLLLLGEAETGVTLLHDMTPRATGPEAPDVDDELDEQGATPRDLLPRARRASGSAKLGDFRELLGKLA